MKENIIKVFSFFIGFFITLFLINYLNLENKKVENFNIKTPSKETYTNNTTNIDNNIRNNELNYQIIPYKKYKYMCINTFFDMKKISNTEGRWYESDLKIEDYNPNINEYHYFTFNKIINLKPNTINNNGSYGADLNSIELRGPKSFYFANNTIINELNEFSMIMSIKIREITSKNNIIFEMTGNTETINKDNQEYTFSIVNINIQKNNNNSYDFILTIGNTIYKGNINDIDKNIINNSDFLILGLIYTNNEITFLINKQMYKYKTNNNFIIKLGSTPVIINKDGKINMELFNFIYYKSVIPINEYLNIFKHNYHYLSGLHTIITTPPKVITKNECKKETKIIEGEDLNKRLDELENKLGKCILEKTQNNDNNMKEVKPFELKIYDNIRETSTNLFNFLF
jgi:hypothetical protein